MFWLGCVWCLYFGHLFGKVQNIKWKNIGGVCCENLNFDFFWHWLPVYFGCDFKILLMIVLKQKLAPDYLCEFLVLSCTKCSFV